MNKTFLLLTILFTYLNVHAQDPSDCQNSIISCGNNNLSLDVNGGGNVQELNGTNNCSVGTENNSLWIKVTVATAGTLGFTLTPASTSIIEDYDFFIFGPNVTCGNLGFAIRCSTTNPSAASQGNNLTGMNGTETDIAEGPGANGNSFIRWLDVNVGESYYLVLDRPAGNSAFSLVWNGTATFSDPPVNNFPVATSINLEDCDDNNDGLVTFDLTLNEAIIVGAQNVTTSYYTNISDAQIGINPIINPTSFSSASTTLYLRLVDNITECSTVIDFDLIVENLIDTQPPNLLFCDTNNDGIHTFDLSQQDNIIIGTQVNPQVSYHLSQADAINNNAPIAILFTNTQNPQTIWTRLEDTVTSCFGTTFFNLEVFDTPTANSPLDWLVCDTDNDGFFQFNFSSLNGQVLNGQNAASFNISYHNTLADADVNNSPLNLYTNANAYIQEQIFVRIENTNNTNCYNTTSFILNVFDTPTTTVLQDWLACDDNSDGFLTFDLTTLNTSILNGFNPTDYSISFHINQNDADSDLNALPTNYTNITAYTPETVFVRIENNLNTNCFDTTSVIIHVFENPIANLVLNWITCDNVDNDGFYDFNLSTLNPQILNGQNIANKNISFHNSQLNADMNLDALDLNYTNTDAFTLETIFVRIENSNKTDCYDTTSFDINVIENPVFDIDEETKYICINLLPQTVSFEVLNPNNNYSYSWRDSNGIELSTSNILNANASGDYTVTATTTDGNNCSTIKTVHLLPAAPAVITNIIIKEYFVDDLFSVFVEITGISNYEFAIAQNGIIGNYQEEPLFLNLSPGLYTVYVREKIGCGTVSEDIAVFGFPKFFTPNGDGINDSWLVSQLAFTPNAKIYIFDRYGKVMTLFYPAKNQGWNGYYNNALVPKADYWFTAEITNFNGKSIIRRGHFSLKN